MIEPSISARLNCSLFGLDILPLFHEKAAKPEMIRHGMKLIKKNNSRFKSDTYYSHDSVSLFTIWQRRISGPSQNFLEKIDLFYFLADFYGALLVT